MLGDGIVAGIADWEGPGSPGDRRVPALLAEARGTRFRWALRIKALVVSLIQLAVRAPGGASHATPDSATTCNFLFPHSELPSNHVAAGIVEDFRYRCKRGLPLPK